MIQKQNSPALSFAIKIYPTFYRSFQFGLVIFVHTVTYIVFEIQTGHVHGRNSGMGKKLKFDNVNSNRKLREKESFDI
jgi:hypothetical protein